MEDALDALVRGLERLGQLELLRLQLPELPVLGLDLHLGVGELGVRRELLAVASGAELPAELAEVRHGLVQLRVQLEDLVVAHAQLRGDLGESGRAHALELFLQGGNLLP